MNDLYRSSISFLRSRQKESGAWYAAPTFPTYHYCWFRDSSYIATAMDLVGEHGCAENFHRWALRVLEGKSNSMAEATGVARREGRVPEDLIIHTRYREDGSPGGEWWENHQLDGLCTWLWSFGNHLRHRRKGGPTTREKEVVDGLADYLSVLWQYPCYDLWEEFGDGIHLYTLASVRAGLKAAEAMTGTRRASVVASIDAFIEANLVVNGRFMKAVGDPRVDASLLGAIVPFELDPPGSPRAEATVAKIRQDLLHGGGVHRYIDDSYYGGGLWILLAAWLGWYDLLTGNVEEAALLRRWIESQADPVTGALPEQTQDHLIEPDSYQPWVEKWGEPAHPLLWSHAMYVILVHTMERIQHPVGDAVFP